MTAGRSAAELIDVFHEVADQLAATSDSSTALAALVDVAVRRIDGAQYAGITIGKHGEEFETVAATDDVVYRCDEIQYEVGTGPCVDAVVAAPIYSAADLRTDPRWPEFGPRCAEETGILSMLSTRLFIESDVEIIAGLNSYSRQPAAFDENSETMAHLLATHGALAVGKAAAQAKARNLLRALETSREIGMAMGILMASDKVTREQAFDLLRVASQRSHRKLADIAAEVAETGALPEEVAAQRR